MDIKVKKFVAIPRDAFELMERRYTTYEDAAQAAADACAESGQAVYVVEMRAVVARADRPVKVTKL